MGAAQKITVGESSYTLGRLVGAKVDIALDIVAQVSDDARAVVDHVSEFERAYRASHSTVITRDFAAQRARELRAAAANARALIVQAPEAAEDPEAEDRLKTKSELEAEAIGLEARADSYTQTLADMGERPQLEFPADPSDVERWLAGLPKALKVARSQVVQLLGLAVVPNSDLRKAWEDDQHAELLTKLGNDLLWEGEPEELAELGVAMQQLVESKLEKLRQYQDAVGKLQGLYARAQGRPVQSKATTPSSSPTSSTPSPEPTDGDTSESSSDSTGTSSSPSVPA